MSVAGANQNDWIDLPGRLYGAPLLVTPRANAEEFDGVVDIDIAMLGSHRHCPRFDGWTFNLDRPGAAATHQVVMMGRTALAIGRLSGGGLDHVDLAPLAEDLQRPIDRGEANFVPIAPQSVVDVLGAKKLVCGPQSRSDCFALARAPSRFRCKTLCGHH